MNRYPLWKNLIVVVVVLVGLFYALPNFFGEEPALQISKRDGGMEQAALSEAQSALRAAGIEYSRADLQDDSGLIRFNSTDDQLEAVDVVRAALGGDYPVALNLAPAAPTWLTDLGALPMYLGLDLRGGVHFLMQVDMGAAIKTALERRVDGMRADLRGERLRYVSAEVTDEQRIQVRFRDAESRDQ